MTSSQPKRALDLIFTFALLSAILTGAGSIITGISGYIANKNAAIIAGAVLSGVGTIVTGLSKVIDEHYKTVYKNQAQNAVRVASDKLNAAFQALPEDQSNILSIKLGFGNQAPDRVALEKHLLQMV